MQQHKKSTLLLAISTFLFACSLIHAQSKVALLGGGKTIFLREIIKTLGLDLFLFLNFEDERIVPITDIDLFIEAYYELYHEKPHIFLDEVQNTEN